MPPARPVNPLQAASGNDHPVKARHALVQWCLSAKVRTKGTEKNKLIISRSNRFTKKIEKYETQRPASYATNPLIKLLDIYCRLKAWSGPSGLIKDRSRQMTDIAKFCECSINKFKPAVNELHRMGWIHVDDYCIQVKSEKTVYALCGIEYDRKIDHVYKKPEKIKDEKQTHYWLYVADISDNRQRQAYVVYKKVMQNPELKLWFFGLLSLKGYDIAAIEKDPLQVCAILNNEYRNSFHSTESEMHDWLTENRPDVNRSVYGMASAWDTCPQNVSYIKKRIANQLLAFIQKIGTIDSEDKMRNKHVHLVARDGAMVPRGVLWNKKTCCTFQAFCDDIDPRRDYNFNDLKFSLPVAA